MVLVPTRKSGEKNPHGKVRQRFSDGEQVKGNPIDQQTEDHDPFSPKSIHDRTHKQGGKDSHERFDANQTGDGGQRNLKLFPQVDGHEWEDHADPTHADRLADKKQPELAGEFPILYSFLVLPGGYFHKR
jgi:hypothetical protein